MLHIDAVDPRNLVRAGKVSSPDVRAFVLMEGIAYCQPRSHQVEVDMVLVILATDAYWWRYTENLNILDLAQFDVSCWPDPVS